MASVTQPDEVGRLRAAIETALEALEAGDQRAATEYLLSAVEGGPCVYRCACEHCGEEFEWPGLLERHQTVWCRSRTEVTTNDRHDWAA